MTQQQSLLDNNMLTALLTSLTLITDKKRGEKKMTTTIKAIVRYEAGLGGTHPAAGLYRHNPVTGEERFSAWLGLGYAPESFERLETVCAKCGDSIDPIYKECGNGCR